MRPNNVVGAGRGDSIKDWYHALPFVTKILLTGTILCTCLASFGIVSGGSLIFDHYRILYDFNFWRLFTPFIFVGGFSFNFAMHCMVLYQNCKRYEEGPIDTGARGTSADMLCMILFGMPFFLLAAYFMNYIILSDPLLFMIMHVWSRKNPETLLNFYGFSFQGQYQPWIYVCLRLVMGGDPIPPLIGILVGQIYFFAVERYDLIWTPKFCVEIVNYFSTNRVLENQARNAAPPAGGGSYNSANANAGARPTTTGGGGYNWGGSGRRLGAE